MSSDKNGRTSIHPSLKPARPHRGILAVFVAGVSLQAAGVPALAVVLLGSSGYDALARSYPGIFTSLLSAILRVVAEGASWLTVGALVCALFLRAVPGQSRRLLDHDFEVRVGRASALVWAGSAFLLIPVDAADANGQTIETLLLPGALPYLVQGSYLPGAWIVAFILASASYFLLALGSRWTTFLPALLASMLAVLAPVVVGQVLVGPGHDFGSDAAIIGVPVSAALFGASTVLTLRLCSGRAIRPGTLDRFVRMAWFAWPLVLGSEMVLAAFKLVGPDPWQTATATLILTRLGLLVGLACLFAFTVIGERRRRISRHQLTLLSCVGTTLSLTYLLVGVVMTRIPPPQYFVPTTIAEVFFGFTIDEAPTLTVLATSWRPNILFAVIAVSAVILYLAALRRVRSRGHAWPLGRTVSWVLGWVVVVVATSSGLGKYSGIDFGVHMTVHMALNMLAPLLLVMGGVVTLFLRATTPAGTHGAAGPHEWLAAVLKWRVLRVLYNPLLIFVLFIGSYYGLYFTGLFEEAMRFHWGHQAMNLHFLIVGYLYYSLIIGVDRPPRPLPHLGRLGFVLAAMPFHAFFGVILMTSTTLIAEDFYRQVGAPWADLSASQYVGGGVAWAGGELPLLIVIIALGIQWARQDQREAVRKDRHFDSGLDDDFEEYNAMLRRLANRRATADSREDT